MIIFNEKEYVEKNYFKKDFVLRTSEDLYRIVRYYASDGKDAAETRAAILELKCSEKMLNEILDDFNFAAIYLKASSRPIRTEEPIWITKYEYDLVREIGDVEKEKILFFMIFMQKFHCSSVFRLTLKEIKTMAMTQLTNKDIAVALDELEKSGYITKFDNKKYKVNTNYMYVIKSDNYLCVDNYNRIVAPYLRTIKTNEYFYCESCGRRILYHRNDIKSHKKRKYCNSCAVKIRNGEKS